MFDLMVLDVLVILAHALGDLHEHLQLGLQPLVCELFHAPKLKDFGQASLPHHTELRASVHHLKVEAEEHVQHLQILAKVDAPGCVNTASMLGQNDT